MKTKNYPFKTLMPPIRLDQVIKYKTWDSAIMLGSYHNGGFSIQLEDPNTGEPIATVTRWLEHIPAGCVALDVNNCGREIVDLLIKAGVIQPNLIIELPSGWITYPVYLIHPNILTKLTV